MPVYHSLSSQTSGVDFRLPSTPPAMPARRSVVLSEGQLSALSADSPSRIGFTGALTAGALGHPRGVGWGGRWEGVQDGEHMYTHG